jgi:hypothetical protein
MTTQFANADDFLDRVMAELGFDGNNDTPLYGSVDGSKNPKTSIKISADAKALLSSALNGPDMDLTANSHASAKSHCTNISSLTGNSTNQSINTKQFAIAHKSRALALASKKKLSAQLQHKNGEMARRLQELKSVFAQSAPINKPITILPAPEAHWSSKIAGTTAADPVGGPKSDGREDDGGACRTIRIASATVADPFRCLSTGSVSVNDGESSNPYNQMIPPCPIKNLPIMSAPHDPSKTCPPATNEEFHDPSLYDGMTDNDGSDSDSDDRIIPPQPTKNPPVKSVSHDPSKTSLQKHMINNDLPIPILGGGGTTQYQPSNDDDDTGSDLPLSNQGGGFTSHYHFPQRTADGLPLWRIPLSRADKTKSKQPVHTLPDFIPPGGVYVPFPPSSGRGANMYYPCLR